MEQLTFKLEAFEGPLDLLLKLIQKNKINIYDIPIAMILEQYMEILSDMKSFDLDISSEFLVLAATLLNIKSKMLLPAYEDEEEQEDPREELVRKLLEYQQYKEFAGFLGENINAGSLGFYKTPETIEPPERRFDISRLTLERLLASYRDAFSRIERRTPPPVSSFQGIVGHEIVHVRDKVIEIWKKLVFGIKVKYQDIFRGSRSRAEVVAMFLAVLELIKMKKIDVSYEQNSQNLFVKKIDDNMDFDIIGVDDVYGTE